MSVGEGDVRVVRSAQPAGGVDLASDSDLDRGRLGRGMNINQDAGRLEQAVDFRKGMNHARRFDSSKAPGKQHQIEGWRSRRQAILLDPDGLELDSVSQLSR